jgi:hypothetical protein
MGAVRARCACPVSGIIDAISKREVSTEETMLTFNDILRKEKIDPRKVRLVRHHFTGHPERPKPYDLWLRRDGSLEKYQRIQKKPRFKVGGLLATFVVTPYGQTLFIGLYSVVGLEKVPAGVIDPISGKDVTGLHFYRTRPDKRLAEYMARLSINWGAAGQAWVQRAHKNEKAVTGIENYAEPPFPGFTEFTCDSNRVAEMPQRWREVLKNVKGVYLLVCKETGKQYVGSAKGDDSLWGRFLDYAKNGHGGNVELKARGPRVYQMTVLEVVNSDSDAAVIEEAWKRKLMTRQFGLNRN